MVILAKMIIEILRTLFSLKNFWCENVCRPVFASAFKASKDLLLIRRHGLHESSCVGVRDKCAGAGQCGLVRMMPGYRVGRPGKVVEDIMYEIISQGPVLAIMDVRRELFSYRSGVYQSSGREQVIGQHAVRIIGWGEESTGIKYWTVANSWGGEWGERGLMRMRRGDNESRIEEMVTGAWLRGRRRERRRRRRRYRSHF